MSSCSLHPPSRSRRVWNGKCVQLNTRPRSPPNINAATATVGCCCSPHRHSARMPQPQRLDTPLLGNNPSERRWKASPGAPHMPTTLTWRRYHGHGSAQEIRSWGVPLQVAHGVALPLPLGHKKRNTAVRAATHNCRRPTTGAEFGGDTSAQQAATHSTEVQTQHSRSRAPSRTLAGGTAQNATTSLIASRQRSTLGT